MMMNGSGQQGLLGSMMFMLGNYQLSCRLEANQLHLSISMAPFAPQNSQKLALHAINTHDSAI